LTADRLIVFVAWSLPSSQHWSIPLDRPDAADRLQMMQLAELLTKTTPATGSAVSFALDALGRTKSRVIAASTQSAVLSVETA
jgi:hypothetical protein